MVTDGIRDEMAKSFALAEENCFINGDTTHTATQTVESSASEGDWYVYDQRLAFDGIRKVASGTPVDLNGSAMGLGDISKAIKNLGKYGRDKSELLLIVSLREEDKLRQLLGINLALNQLGLTGTALPGEVGKVWGVPVVATLLLREDYGSGDKSEGLILNRNAAVIGDRRVFTIKSSDEVLLRTDQLLIVASERLAFKAQYPDAVVKLINIGTA